MANTETGTDRRILNILRGIFLLGTCLAIAFTRTDRLGLVARVLAPGRTDP